jgi:hypothetical protein
LAQTDESTCKKAAQILSATVFQQIVTGMCHAIQRQSTMLSTGFCGYRLINYMWPVGAAQLCSFGAVQKLAAPCEIP